jgi:hypothetical protein
MGTTMTSSARMQMLLFGFWCFLSVGCVSLHRDTTGGWVGADPLQPNAKICLLKTPDGVERQDGAAIGSGAAVTAALREQLIQHGYAVVPSKESEVERALPGAISANASYILVGMLPEWEDNATEWSGRPDRTSLLLELYSVPGGDLVGTGKHRVVSSTSQMVSRETDRFVPELADHSLAKLFGWRPTVYTPK